MNDLRLESAFKTLATKMMNVWGRCANPGSVFDEFDYRRTQIRNLYDLFPEVKQRVDSLLDMDTPDHIEQPNIHQHIDECARWLADLLDKGK